MKDECDGYGIEEFVGIRAKCYSFRMNSQDEEAFFNSKLRTTRKNKGIKKSVVRQQIKHQDYLDCLLDDKMMNVRMYNLQSRNHQITLSAQVKRALINYDDKRYILPDGVSTIAHGHFALSQVR